MKKKLVAAFLITAGAGGLAFAQGTSYNPNWISWPYEPNLQTVNKVGVLSLTLQNTFQAFGKSANGSGAPWGVETKPNRGGINHDQPWDNFSYQAIENCVANPTTYRRSVQIVNTPYVIRSINAAFSQVSTLAALPFNGLFKAPGVNINPNPYLNGSFGPTTAKIVVINYDNRLKAPPYPPTEDNFYSALAQLSTDPVYNAPWVLQGVPGLAVGGLDGDLVPLKWPNQNYISWGKPYTDPFAGTPTAWIGNKVYIIDPNNPNVNLQCFDVTPFFAFEEAFCFYCWDTMDRVTEGKIYASTSTSEPPCSGQISSCGRKGNGVTRFYWTVKFNSIGARWTRNPNTLLDWYYGTLLGVSPDWYVIDPLSGVSNNGTELNDADKPGSQTSLAFTLNGIAVYNWAYRTMKRDSSTAPIGTFSMSSTGYGYSPMCGDFNGPVALTEYDSTNSMFNNRASKQSVLCF